MADAGLRATITHTLGLWCDVVTITIKKSSIEWAKTSVDKAIDWVLSFIWIRWDDAVVRIRHHV